MRLEGKVAIIVGAGQSPGEGVGNGRATAVLFAREGARVLAVDRELGLAEATVAVIEAEGGVASAAEADVTDEAAIEKAIAACMTRYGRIDILHNNVGISVAGGDAPAEAITEAAFDQITAVNLRGMVITCKHALPIMREQQSGAIVNISSMAVSTTFPNVAYKTSKAGVVAFTEQLAYQNAEHGIRANVILPGLMDTPMAVDTRARLWDKPRAEIAAERDAKVPLGGKMGTGWDVAYAALFLASDEAKFITGVALRVDGGAGVKTG
ncbi:MAG: SDR family NAD(P)-dependent oxidoreductase [Alphaproteobacteria bacterium]|jgi:NAD(P)-dependent dehydrogenase (short-subunit alcohol dehydrogenase family)|nr:SDR family NAD(P)-dependent oxidoreductase [Alphaproteobacteria bacterium]